MCSAKRALYGAKPMAVSEKHYPGVPAHIEQLGALLTRIARDFAPATLASSFSIEDMVLTDAILGAGLTIDVFTLDTGRLHGDTLDLVGRIERRYARLVGPKRLHDMKQALQRLLADHQVRKADGTA